MEANEFRIGNLIQWNNDDNEIEQINVINNVAVGLSSDELFDTLTPIGMFKPILLTEEWLLKFGFEKDEIRFQFFKDCGDYKMKISINSFSGTIEEDSSWFISILTDMEVNQ